MLRKGLWTTCYRMQTTCQTPSFTSNTSDYCLHAAIKTKSWTPMAIRSLSCYKQQALPFFPDELLRIFSVSPRASSGKGSVLLTTCAYQLTFRKKAETLRLKVIHNILIIRHFQWPFPQIIYTMPNISTCRGAELWIHTFRNQLSGKEVIEKQKKAEDLIRNEMLEHSKSNEQLQLLQLKLFNSCRKHGINPWNVSITTALHKKDDRSDPDNYCAITSCVEKLFSSLLLSCSNGFSPSESLFVLISRINLGLDVAPNATTM